MKQDSEEKKLFKEAERNVKDLERQMKAASFKKMSRYSQRLVKEEYAKATEHLFQLIEAKIINS